MSVPPRAAAASSALHFKGQREVMKHISQRSSVVSTVAPHFKLTSHDWTVQSDAPAVKTNRPSYEQVRADVPDGWQINALDL